jgi:hypothetical protein
MTMQKTAIATEIHRGRVGIQKEKNRAIFLATVLFVPYLLGRSLRYIWNAADSLFLLHVLLQPHVSSPPSNERCNGDHSKCCAQCDMHKHLLCP